MEVSWYLIQLECKVTVTRKKATRDLLLNRVAFRFALSEATWTEGTEQTGGADAGNDLGPGLKTSSSSGGLLNLGSKRGWRRSLFSLA